ncbi:MAG: hypothetical protein AB1414_18845 [bacterium]
MIKRIILITSLTLLIFYFLLLTFNFSHAMGWLFGKSCRSDSISYHAPCWGENNKIYFIKKVTFAVESENPDLVTGGTYFIHDVKYFLCSMNYDGTEKKEIKEVMCEKDINRLKREYKRRYRKEWTGGSKSDAYMSYCKDTNKLVYNVEWGMWSITVDGTDERLLDYEGIHPSWSPDGKEIVYEIFKKGIWIMNADGDNKHRLSTESRIETFDNKTYVVYDDESPIWSPKGDLIAFVCNFWIWVMKPDGSERRKVWKTSHLSDWSPDGTMIMTGGRIVDLNGNSVQLFEEEKEEYIHGLWSPDGTMCIGNRDFVLFDSKTGKIVGDPLSVGVLPQSGKHFVYKKPDNIW